MVHPQVVPDLVHHDQGGEEPGGGVGVALGVGHTDLTNHALVVDLAGPRHRRQAHRREGPAKKKSFLAS